MINDAVKIAISMQEKMVLTNCFMKRKPFSFIQAFKGIPSLNV